MTVDMPPLAPGTEVRGHRIVRFAGRGGFTEVYEATRAGSAVRVALKRLRDRDVPLDVIDQLRRWPPGPWLAVPIDVFHDGGRTWLVEEWADGGTLEDRLRDGRALPPSEVADLGTSLALGLDQVHHLGLVHRDVKPSNVLVVAGQYKLGDFGAAAWIEAPTGRARGGEFAGTPLYMAPEQASGLPASRRSDVFSLGVVLYRAVHGRLPDEPHDDLGGLARARATQPIAVPPSPFQAVIRGCLALDPADRPEALWVAEELRPRIVPGPTEHRPWIPAELPLDEARVPATPGGLPSPPAAPPPAAADRRPAVPSGRRPVRPTRSPGPVGPVVTVVAAALAGGAVVAALGWWWLVRLVGSGVLVAAGFWLARRVRSRAASREPAIERRASEVLFGAASRTDLTQSLKIEVDAVMRSLHSVDSRILGATLRAMVDEYERADRSSDRQAALVNVVTIMEKLRTHLSPWHVRHKEAIATAVAVVGCVSGVAGVVSGFLG